MRGGLLARIVEPLGERLVQGLDDQGRLAAARDAGHAAEGAERDLGGDALQIVAARVEDAKDLAGMADTADRRHRDLALAGQILAGDAVRVGHDRVGRALGDDMPAMDAGARPHIDDPIGGADRLLVVLDDDDRVAEVAQPLQGREQAPVVALVQPDRRLVQHVEHPGQARADLRGQPNALALAAGQRAGSARQGQIFEPDILQKAEPLVDLLQDALGDLALARSQLVADAGEPGAGLGDRQRRDLG